MTDSMRLSARAVATSALAVVLAGGSFVPALADDDKPKKGRSEQAKSESQQRRESAGERRQGPPSPKPGSGRQGGSQQGGSGQRGGQGGAGQQGGGTGQTSDPAGNNGTFKVDGPAYDDGMDNEPHVSCEFRLLFFGFDDDQTGDITIAGQAPSGSGVVSERTGVLLSDDPAGGGPNDPDSVFTYTLSDLDLSGLTAHDKHGYHLKVTVATGEPGGVKHKVFWLEPCAVATTPPAVGGTGTGGTGGDTGGTGTEVGGVAVGGVGTGVSGEEQARTSVLGTKFTRDEAARAARAQVLGTGFARGAGGLAFTGAWTEAMLALGASLVALGGGFVMWARRPRGKHAL